MADNTNFYNQNNMYNPGFMGGAVYNPQPVKPKMTNPLTAEERDALKVDNSFTLTVTPAEMAAAVCTHKDASKGEFSIVPNADGTCTCSICHTTFNPNIVDDATVNQACELVLNCLETIKLMNLDANPELIRGYFQMIPFLKKMPQLWKLSNNSFNRYNAQAPVQQATGNVSYFNALNMLQNPTVPMAQPYGYNYGFQQPMMGQPMMPQQMGMGMTPMMGMQAQTVPGASPFYKDPAAVQQPVNSQPGATYNPPAYNPQPAANNTGDVVVSDQVKL